MIAHSIPDRSPLDEEQQGALALLRGDLSAIAYSGARDGRLVRACREMGAALAVALATAQGPDDARWRRVHVLGLRIVERAGPLARGSAAAASFERLSKFVDENGDLSSAIP
jgi:hypothetical protein